MLLAILIQIIVNSWLHKILPVQHIKSLNKFDYIENFIIFTVYAIPDRNEQYFNRLL